MKEFPIEMQLLRNDEIKSVQIAMKTKKDSFAETVLISFLVEYVMRTHKYYKFRFLEIENTRLSLKENEIMAHVSIIFPNSTLYQEFCTNFQGMPF